MMELRVLGANELRRRRGGEPEAMHLQPKRFALLSYLAVASAHTCCRRESLLSLFWPERDERQGRNALNQSLHQLRSALGSDFFTGRGTEDLRIARKRLWCDATAFESAHRSGDYVRALHLYGGDLLPGLHIDAAPEFDFWLEGERERLRGLALDAARMLSERDEARGDLDGAARWMQRLIEIEPDDEEALRRLLRLLERMGDRARALRIYRRFEQRLERELDLPPSTETVALAEEIRSTAGTPQAAEPASDAEAYDCYLRGCFLLQQWNPTDLTKAVGCFEEAVRRDRCFTRAYAALGEAYCLQGSAFQDVLPSRACIPRATRAVEHALRLDGRQAEAHGTRGILRAVYHWDWKGAEQAIRQARALAPTSGTVRHAAAVVQLYGGHPGEAIRAAVAASRQEPCALAYRETCSMALYLARRYEEALEHARRTLEMAPQRYVSGLLLGDTLAALGRAEEAADAYARVIEMQGRRPYVLSALGRLYAAQCRTDEALQVLAELVTMTGDCYVRPTYLAYVYAALGDHVRALDCLETACAERDVHLSCISVDPRFDSLRPEPRYAALLARVGLP